MEFTIIQWLVIIGLALIVAFGWGFIIWYMQYSIDKENEEFFKDEE